MSLVRCKTCCMPSSRPDVPFTDGECQACINYRSRPAIDWGARREKLNQVLERCDGRVIVPSSGGKDSSYIALRLKELGCDVTAVTATTCHLTPLGRANIDNLARHVRTIEVTPNMIVRGKLNRLAFELVGDPSWGEHVSIHRVPFRVAYQNKVHALFYGECSNDQYGGPKGTEATYIMTQRWASEFAGFLGMRAADFIGIEGITERDMMDYSAPSDAELKEAGVTAYFLGWFESWDSHRNATVAKAAGMQWELPGPMNWWPHENQDSYQVAFHDHAMYRKFGFGRLCSQISVDVRSGLISRDEAMRIVAERDGLFPHVYFGIPAEDICARMGMTLNEVKVVLNNFTAWDLFDGVVDGRPILKEFS